jgi:hypothetical protein
MQQLLIALAMEGIPQAVVMAVTIMKMMQQRLQRPRLQNQLLQPQKPKQSWMQQKHPRGSTQGGTILAGIHGLIHHRDNHI